MTGKRDEFLKTQKILRLATIDQKGRPHVVPVWYLFSSTRKKFYVGTNTRTAKAKNVKKNKHVSFCADTGVHSPNIYGIMGRGKATLILQKQRVSKLAKMILAKYYKSLKIKSAQEILDDTDCIIEIVPGKLCVWSY